MLLPIFFCLLPTFFIWDIPELAVDEPSAISECPRLLFPFAVFTPEMYPKEERLRNVLEDFFKALRLLELFMVAGGKGDREFFGSCWFWYFFRQLDASLRDDRLNCFGGCGAAVGGVFMACCSGSMVDVVSTV